MMTVSSNVSFFIGIEMFLADNASLEKCKNDNLAFNSTVSLIDFLIYEKDKWLQRCPVPCTQTIYQLTVTRFHQNSFIYQGNINTNNGMFYLLYMNYDTFAVEKTIEMLRYDLLDFFTQAGGNLGLFLGCSCFSFLLSSIKLIRSLNFKLFK